MENLGNYYAGMGAQCDLSSEWSDSRDLPRQHPYVIIDEEGQFSSNVPTCNRGTRGSGTTFGGSESRDTNALYTIKHIRARMESIVLWDRKRGQGPWATRSQLSHTPPPPTFTKLFSK